MRSLIQIFLFILSLAPSVFAGSNRCRVYEELADPKYNGNHSLRRFADSICGDDCSLDEVEKIHERVNRSSHYSGSNAHHRENEQVLSIVRNLGLNRDQQRRLHDEITGQGLSRQEIFDRARDLLGH